MFRDLFIDERFCPDYLKIYPTLVTEGTPLYDLWKRGGYDALDLRDAVELIAQVKAELPKMGEAPEGAERYPSPTNRRRRQKGQLATTSQKSVCANWGANVTAYDVERLGLQGITNVEAVERRVEKYTGL